MSYRLVKKKRPGSGNIVSAALICIISFLGLYLMTMLIVNTYKTLENMNHISHCMRNYLIKMEVQGCLTEGDVENMVADLQEFGMTEIHLYGNFSDRVFHAAVVENLGSAAYGETVQLRLKGTLEVKSMEQESEGILNFSIGSKNLTVDLSQKGISVR